MEENSIEKTEILIKKTEISIADVKKICLAVAEHDPKAYGMLSTHKLKRRYTGLLNKLTGEVERAIEQDYYKDVRLKLHEYAKMIHRYSMLKPNLLIEKVLINDEEYIKVSETDKRMKQDYLRIVFEYVRQNINNNLRGTNDRKKKAFTDELEVVESDVVTPIVNKKLDDILRE